jgi:predicted nucleic acid-binding protein
LYGEVQIATGVLEELNARGRRWPGYDETSRASWIKQHVVHNQDLIAVLLRDLDRGEAETLALAIELGADLVLMDERDGRRFAQRLGYARSESLVFCSKRKSWIVELRSSMPRSPTPRCRFLLE